MEINTAARVFAALGHPGRLAVFRLLVRLAPQGMRPTEMAGVLGMRANTLSHHLGALERAGLIACQRQGRSLFYSVEAAATAGLVGYLVKDCCRARPDLAAEAGTEPGGPEAPYNVLFICSANSARSLFAEALLNWLGEGRFRAFSAGTRPGARPDPHALQLLRREGFQTATLRSKSVAEFKGPEAPRMDFVLTVCDAAASEECPPFAGAPLTAHWGVPDPVRAEGAPAEVEGAFARAFRALSERVLALTALPLDQLDRLALQQALDRIGLDPA